MDMAGEEQRIYEYMERLPPHRASEWHIQNPRWYLEYARQYGTACGIPQGRPQENPGEKGEEKC